MGEPPRGVEDYDFSYAAKLARQTGQSKFRWRLNGEEWLCDRIAGMCDVDSIKQKGHVTVRGQLLLRNEGSQTVAYIYPDPALKAETIDDVDGLELPNSHWRLCANLAGADNDKWRLRNERTNELTHVRGYVGKASLNWFDKGSHVFHDGPIVIDKDNVAHLFSSD